MLPEAGENIEGKYTRPDLPTRFAGRRSKEGELTWGSQLVWCDLAGVKRKKQKTYQIKTSHFCETSTFGTVVKN